MILNIQSHAREKAAFSRLFWCVSGLKWLQMVDIGMGEIDLRGGEGLGMLKPLPYYFSNGSWLKTQRMR